MLLIRGNQVVKGDRTVDFIQCLEPGREPGDVATRGHQNLERIGRGIGIFEQRQDCLHRLGLRIAQFHGITFVNDSKATTVESTHQALGAYPGPILLIAGGRDKEGAFGSLREILSQKVKRLFLIGETQAKMRKAFAGSVALESCGDLSSAVWKAYREAKAGQVVLLSPMCASFDMFDNFEARGRAFKETVRQLIEKETRCVRKGASSFSSS